MCPPRRLSGRPRSRFSELRIPKFATNDSGLYAYLLNLAPTDDRVGFLIEDFVATELIKLIGFEGLGAYALMHFRTCERKEVDFVVEAADRRIVGIEVKTATTLKARDFDGLKALEALAGDRCESFGPKRWAVPISALWQ